MSVSPNINNVRPTTNIINAKFSYRQIIISTMEGELYLPMLLSTVLKSQILLNTKQSLVSIGALYDKGCIVTLRIKGLTVM